jgi:hypothetical protein
LNAKPFYDSIGNLNVGNLPKQVMKQVVTKFYLIFHVEAPEFLPEVVNTKLGHYITKWLAFVSLWSKDNSEGSIKSQGE